VTAHLARMKRKRNSGRSRPAVSCDDQTKDLIHAPVKKSVLIPNATHFVLFEKPCFQFFEAILNFLEE
jgi:hypothetical protein